MGLYKYNLLYYIDRMGLYKYNLLLVLYKQNVIVYITYYIITDDDKCDDQWGNCKNTARGCKGGAFGVNLCAGPRSRMCCVQDGNFIVTS